MGELQLEAGVEWGNRGELDGVWVWRGISPRGCLPGASVWNKSGQPT